MLWKNQEASTNYLWDRQKEFYWRDGSEAEFWIIKWQAGRDRGTPECVNWMDVKGSEMRKHNSFDESEISL